MRDPGEAEALPLFALVNPFRTRPAGENVELEPAVVPAAVEPVEANRGKYNLPDEVPARPLLTPESLSKPPLLLEAGPDACIGDDAEEDETAAEGRFCRVGGLRLSTAVTSIFKYR